MIISNDVNEIKYMRNDLHLKLIAKDLFSILYLSIIVISYRMEYHSLVFRDGTGTIRQTTRHSHNSDVSPIGGPSGQQLFAYFIFFGTDFGQMWRKSEKLSSLPECGLITGRSPTAQTEDHIANHR